jgi:hypothetical protein
MAVAAGVCLVCLMTAATEAGQLQRCALSCSESAKTPALSCGTSVCVTMHMRAPATFLARPMLYVRSVVPPHATHPVGVFITSSSHPVTVLFCYLCNTQTAPSTWAGCPVRLQHTSPASLLVTTAGTLQACQQTQRPSSATGESIVPTVLLNAGSPRLSCMVASCALLVRSRALCHELVGLHNSGCFMLVVCSGNVPCCCTAAGMLATQLHSTHAPRTAAAAAVCPHLLKSWS